MFVSSNILTDILTDKELVNNDLLKKLLIKLHLTNLKQWNMENIVRKKDLSDRERVCCKEEIDTLNALRVSIIEQIDEYIFSKLKQNFDSIPHTETPGTIYDKVIVALIKKKAILDYQNKSFENINHIDYEIFSEQVEYLLNSMDIYFERLKKGDTHFRLFKQMKIYE